MVATVAQALPTTAVYSSPGFSTPNCITQAIVPSYLQEIERKEEKVSEVTSNQLNQFYRRQPILQLAKALTATLIESLTISDSTARLAAKARAPPTESLALSSNAARLAAKIRALATETITLADTIARRVDYQFEIIKIVDSVAIVVTPHTGNNIVKTLTETLTLASTVTKLAAKARTPPTESLTLAATPVRLAAKQRPLPVQSITLTSTPARLLAKARSIIEPLTISSTPAKLVQRIRLLSEAITISSTLGKLLAKIRIPDEIIYDNYEAGTYSFVQGNNSPNNKWNNHYLGGIGASSGVRFSSSVNSNVMWEIPQASITSSETHATLNMTTSSWSEFDVTVRQRTIQQLRTGSAPNAWETAWILFRFTDDTHHYYFTFKTSGIELGRKDYTAGSTDQTFLATNTTPTLTIGTWNTVRIKAVKNHFTVWIDGTQVIDMTDDGTVGFDSATSGLPPPPSAAMYSGSIGLYNEDAEVEFDDFKILPLGTIVLSSSVAGVKIRAVAKTITESLTISSTLARLAAKIRTATETITLSSTPTRLNTLARAISQTVTLASAITKSKGAIKLLTESVTISSILTRLVAKTRTITETVTLTSTPAKISAKIRALAIETVTISSTVARVIGARAINKTLTETLILSATLNRLATKARSITADSLTLTATPTKLGAKLRPLAIESITISSTVQRLKAATKTITETLTLATTPTRLSAKIRIFTESLTITSTVARIKSGGAAITKSLTETITLASTVTNARAKIRLLTETLTTVANLNRLATKNRALPTQSITIAASTPTRLRGLVRTVTNTLNAIATTPVRLSQKIRTRAEQLTLTDQAQGLGPRTLPPVKIPQKPSISILAQELRYVTTRARDVPRLLFETVHLSDLPRLEVKRYSKAIRTAKVKKIVRILDLVKLADDIYNRSKY